LWEPLENAEPQFSMYTGNALRPPNFSSAGLLGTPTFKLAYFKKEKQQTVSRNLVSFRSQPAGYSAITHRHRGVSASSFCEGAIPF